MIDMNLYIPFVLAATLLILMPGPVVSITVANALNYGTRHGLRTVVGASSGTTLLLLVGGLGMASAFALLAQWFEWLRWCGAAYLVFLGIQVWRSKPQSFDDADIKARPNKSSFWQGFMVSITNPKSILFFAAFFPQFINPALPAGPQLLILSLTFLILAFMLDSSYALLSGRLRPYLADARRARIRNRVTGSLMIGTGLVLAFARKV